jgi:hypothetical protein
LQRDEKEQNCSVLVLRRVADLFTPKDATQQKYSVPSRRRMFTPSNAPQQNSFVPNRHQQSPGGVLV